MKMEVRFSRPAPVTKFSAVLDMLITASGHTSNSLARKVEQSFDTNLSTAIREWRNGYFVPRGGSGNKVLQRIERHCGCTAGFLGKIIDSEMSQRDIIRASVRGNLQSAADWHLPTDFDQRSEKEQQEIQNWLAANVLDATTDFGKYISKRTSSSYAIVFPTLHRKYGARSPKGKSISRSHPIGHFGSYGSIAAPPQLAREMEEFVNFKTALFPPEGYRRYSRWIPVTAYAVVQKYGYLFGALTAAPFSRDAGLGVTPSKLTLALLIFPSVLSWYLDWSEKRKGFFTFSDTTLVYQIRLLFRNPSGWLHQNPQLSKHLQPIDGLVTSKDIAAVCADWSAACDRAYFSLGDRALELMRIRRGHRDAIAPILPVINSERPLAEYRRIADEILRLMPDPKHEPEEAAIAVRSYLMLRLAMHLGIRQGNLRDLLICRKGERPRSPQKLATLRRGELRWNPSTQVWEVFIPAHAFKNCRSSYFSGRPFLCVLPDLENLYAWIDSYLSQHRSRLLNGIADPGTFFVKWVRRRGLDPAYDRQEFYVAWKDVVRRYGIYNPYTKRGAIKGLLPHGPHCIRDVIATHILKETGSYELAGYAIQTTVQVVMRHYAQFHPHEKAAKAAEIMNKIWQ